uniref:Proliferating cell nuclear antigen n=1 Tax=Lingulaulax polyedra TaxID=160621 RepID=A0A516AG16_LINPO|nr:proliferating cell nuclear antigen [Lingulodinium polyedra]
MHVGSEHLEIPEQPGRAQDVVFDCCEKGLQVLSLDSSHVALVSLPLREASSEFKCGRPSSLCMNVGSLTKILKMCGPSDSLKLRWRGGATVSFQRESGEKGRIADFVLKLMQVVSEHSFQRGSGEEGRIADLELKLMHVACEHMGIPEYQAGS